MKLENLIVQYLYKNKSVRLQDIGTFTLAPDVHIPLETDKDAVLPANSIKFDYDPKAKADEGLIEYIMEHTRKIRPLATSDLESFSNLNTQFINIGKPLVLEGIGTIGKAKAGNYEFIQGKAFNAKADVTPLDIKERPAEEISYESEPRSKENNSWIWWLLGLLLLIGGGIGYYLATQNSDSNRVEPVNADTNKVVAPTVVTDTTVKDTTAPIAVPSAIPNSGTLNIAFKDFQTLAGANQYKTKLETYGHKLAITANADSSRITVYMPINKPLADSVAVKDSIRRFFGVKPYVIQ